MSRTIDEINAALTSVRQAITAAETAQEYSSQLGGGKRMANLEVLYAREQKLLDERAAVASGSVAGGIVRNYGVVQR